MDVFALIGGDCSSEDEDETSEVLEETTGNEREREDSARNEGKRPPLIIQLPIGESGGKKSGTEGTKCDRLSSKSGEGEDDFDDDEDSEENAEDEYVFDDEIQSVASGTIGSKNILRDDSRITRSIDDDTKNPTSIFIKHGRAMERYLVTRRTTDMETERKAVCGSDESSTISAAPRTALHQIANICLYAMTGQYNLALSKTELAPLFSGRDVSKKKCSVGTGDCSLDKSTSDLLRSAARHFKELCAQYNDDIKDDALRYGQRLRLLAFAIAALNMFVQANFTGPPIDSNLETVRLNASTGSVNLGDAAKTRQDIHTSSLAKDLEKRDRSSDSSASSGGIGERPNPAGAFRCSVVRLLGGANDGESSLPLRALACDGGSMEIYSLVKFPEALVFARALLSALRCTDVDAAFPLVSVEWWEARAIAAHQRFLVERGGAAFGLWKMSTTLLARAHQNIREWWSISERPDVEALVLLEGCQCHLIASHITLARRCLRAAERALNIRTRFAGVAGKRTKYQSNEIAQLVVLLKRSNPMSDRHAKAPLMAKSKVHEVRVEDYDEHTHLLENVELTEKAPASATDRLRVIEQRLFLLHARTLKKSCAQDALLIQQVRAFVERVVVHPQSFALHTAALIERSRLEIARSHTRERALLQLQSLVENLDRSRDDAATTDIVVSNATVVERTCHIDASSLPPVWELQRELGGYYLVSGMVKTALSNFEKLELWEEAVSCMIVMGHRTKAERRIRDMVKSRNGECPELLCLLGSLTQSKEHFLKAWKVSDRRCGRAMRQLGRMEFEAGELEAAAEHLAAGLELSPLRMEDWFLLGSIYIRLKRFRDALGPYQRVVAQQSEDANAWANLAAAHAHLDNFRAAYAAMKVALKHRTKDWKMWNNFALFAVRVGSPLALIDSVQAFEKILDIREARGGAKGMTIDVGLLACLVETVMKGVVDSRVAESKRTTSARPSKDRLDVYTERDAYESLLKPLRALLKRAANDLGPTSHKVWSVCASFFRSVGDLKEALESRQWQCRTFIVNNPTWCRDKRALQFASACFVRLSEACEEAIRASVVRSECLTDRHRWAKAASEQIPSELRKEPSAVQIFGVVAKLKALSLSE